MRNYVYRPLSCELDQRLVNWLHAQKTGALRTIMSKLQFVALASSTSEGGSLESIRKTRAEVIREIGEESRKVEGLIGVYRTYIKRVRESGLMSQQRGEANEKKVKEMNQCLM